MDVRISSKGWIVIPAKLRRKYNLNPGDRMTVVDYGGIVSLVPHAKDPVVQAAGMLRGRGSLTEELRKEHRRERRRGRWASS
jgi:AbrB family looped-hinge helix DNA binding protein